MNIKCPDCRSDMDLIPGGECDYYGCPTCKIVWDANRLAEAWEALADYWKDECKKGKESKENKR